MSLSSLFSLFSLSLFLILLLPSPLYSLQCRGRTFVRSSEGRSGVISSNTDGQYIENNDCYWVFSIAGPEPSLTLVLDRFDTEFGFDYVSIYRGSPPVSQSNLVQLLTGPIESFSERTFYLSGSTFTVFFHSDELLVSTGFQMTYYLGSCIGKCVNGFCKNTICACEPGFVGDLCESANCSTNIDCSNNGQCLANRTCSCLPGYYGGTCGELYCEKQTVMPASRGKFVSNHGGGTYLSNSNCSWLISPPAPVNSIALSFTAFDTEFEYDLVKVYDGPDTTFDLLAIFSGSNIPWPIYGTRSQMLVTFETDESVVRSGFTAEYASYSCPNNCQNRGQCILGVCSCYPGYNGTSCEQQYCPNNCNNRGTCVGGSCNCTFPYRGVGCNLCSSSQSPSCSTPYVTCTQNSVKRLNTSTGELYFYLSPDQKGNCSWVIQLQGVTPGSTLGLRFSEFMMLGATITVTEDKNLVIGRYSGGSVPPYVVSTTPNVTISIQASTWSFERNFVLHWEPIICPKNCSGNGLCGANGICTCNLGWNSTDCSTPQCVNRCFGRGDCVAGRCVCQPGYFGPACSQLYCSGESMYTSLTAVIADHDPSLSFYRRLSNCTFIIKPPTTQMVSIVFTSFQTEIAHDFVSVFDGDGVPMMGNYSGSYLPVPVLVRKLPAMIRFESNEANEYLGWRATYMDNSLCPNSCSGRGYCFRQKCLCFGGYTGDNCADLTEQINLRPGFPVDDTVDRFQWKIYFVNAGSGPINVRLESKSNQMLLLFLQSDSPPTLTNYQLSHNIPPLNPKELRLSATSNQKIYIGVYGHQADDFNLIAMYNEQSSGPSNARTASVVVAVIVIVLFGLVTLSVVAYFVYKTINAPPPGTQDPTGAPPQVTEVPMREPATTTEMGTMDGFAGTNTAPVMYIEPSKVSSPAAPSGGEETSELSGIPEPSGSATGYARFDK